MPRNCVNQADNFCYICGEITSTEQRRVISAIIRKAYHLYFGCQIGDQDKIWAPHICCNTCETNLTQWLNKKRKAMPFAVPMVWREPTDHVTNCYFCLVPPIKTLINPAKRRSVKYPNITSAIRPVRHGDSLPIPEPPSTYSLESDTDTETTDEKSVESVNYECDVSVQPHMITQQELNDLVRDLDLPKYKAEILGSRLQQWNLLDKDVNISRSSEGLNSIF